MKKIRLILLALLLLSGCNIIYAQDVVKTVQYKGETYIITEVTRYIWILNKKYEEALNNSNIEIGDKQSGETKTDLEKRRITGIGADIYPLVDSILNFDELSEKMQNYMNYFTARFLFDKDTRQYAGVEFIYRIGIFRIGAITLEHIYQLEHLFEQADIVIDKVVPFSPTKQNVLVPIGYPIFNKAEYERQLLDIRNNKKIYWECSDCEPIFD